jgi:hypothetical protein
MVFVCSAMLNIKTLYILPPIACVSCMDLRTNSDYFPIHY